MKKSILALAAFAIFSGSVMAGTNAVGEVPLQWAGTVPAAVTENDNYLIVPEAGTDLAAVGSLVFANDAVDGISLNSASTFTFSVTKDADQSGDFSNGDTANIAFDMELTKLAVGLGGLPSTENTGYFKVMNNGAEVVSTGATTGVTQANVTLAEDDVSTLKVGDDVVVQAYLAISSDL